MTSFNKRKFSAAPKALIASLVILATSYSVAFARQSEPVIASGQIMISFAAGTTLNSVKSIAESSGCDVLSVVPYTPNCYVFAVKNRDTTKAWDIPTDTVKASVISLKSVASVLSASLNVKRIPTAASVIPNDPMYDKMWGLRMIRMPEAWAIQEGKPVTVAVLDTGVDASHPEFTDASGASVIVKAADFSGDGLGAAADPVGHGTHVAGTIGAVTDNGIGVPSVAGWQRGGIKTMIMPVRVLGANGGTVAGEVAGINYAILQKARAINMSLGSAVPETGPPSPEEVTAINSAVANGVVVIVSAGNSTTNSETGQFIYPGDIPGVIKVSAVGPGRNVAYYSSYGRKPNSQLIAAPGGDLSLRNGDLADGIWSLQPGNKYASEQGTSMAAPHVTGLVALMLAAGAAPTNVYSLLAKHAQAPPVPNPTIYGPGIIDAYSTLLDLVDPTPGVVFPTVVSSGTNAASTDRGVSYFGPTPIKVTISGAANIVNSSVTPTGKQLRQSALTVEAYRLGESAPFRTFVGGTDFLVPQLNSADLKTSTFTVDVPSVATNRLARPSDTGVKLPDTILPPGQSYKIVTKVSGVATSTQFIAIGEKRLTPGRSMFALPFRAGKATGTGSVENQLLGSATTFGLTRYNPLRLPSEEDYARYLSNGSVLDPAARFLVSSAQGAPLTYDIADPTTSLAPIGVGYWLDLANATKIDTARLTEGRDSAVGLNATNAVGIRVFASGGGWNMIGAPFPYPVEWSSVSVQSGGVNYSLADAVANGIISSVLVGYDTERRDYSYAIAPGGSLQPFNAYWIRAFRDAVIIVPPTDSSAGRALKSAPKLPLSGGWTARFVASVAGDQDGQNYFGQVPGAQDGVDKVDVPKPPAGSGHSYVRFESKDAASASTRSLAFDLRSSSAGRKQEWVAAVTSDRTNAEVTLSWEGLRSVPKRYKLTLKDQATGQLVAMQGRASYTYRAAEAGATRRFSIVLEPQTSAGGLLVTNVRTSGGTRAESGMTIRFATNQDAEVNGVIRTMSGKTVATLLGATRAQAGGDTALHWNGKGPDGAAIPAGPYVLEVVARGTDGSTVRVARTIQHLR